MADSETQEPLLEARGVTRLFGNAYALRDAAITLRRHEICGLLGANGAGKSTLSRIVCGHLSPSSGEILFKGAPLAVGSARTRCAPASPSSPRKPAWHPT